jgi:hypothetical protein
MRAVQVGQSVEHVAEPGVQLGTVARLDDADHVLVKLTRMVVCEDGGVRKRSGVMFKTYPAADLAVAREGAVLPHRAQ